MFPSRYSHRKHCETTQIRAHTPKGLVRGLYGPSKLHSAIETGIKNPSSPRTISTSLLQALLLFQIWPINLVVFQGSYPLKEVGELILRPASRLDAFSGYPIRT